MLRWLPQFLCMKHIGRENERNPAKKYVLKEKMQKWQKKATQRVMKHR